MISDKHDMDNIMIVEDLDKLVYSLKNTIRENSLYLSDTDLEKQEFQSYRDTVQPDREIGFRSRQIEPEKSLFYRDELESYREVQSQETETTFKVTSSKPPIKPDRKTQKPKRKSLLGASNNSREETGPVILAEPPLASEQRNSQINNDSDQVSRMTVSLQNNLSELDTLLADLNSARYAAEQNDRAEHEQEGAANLTNGQADGSNLTNGGVAGGSLTNGDVGGDGGRSTVSNSNYAYGDYYSDLDSSLDEKAPSRPPPPKSYSPHKATRSQDSKTPTSPIPPIAQRKPRKPPKLMHVLVPGERRRVHDLARENRENDDMEIDVPDDGTDYGDYTSKWEYLGKGIWENQDYGSVSNYSTLKTSRDEYDYATLPKSPAAPVLSEDELEKETGAGPRGERSKYIETDHGEVKSKYHYLGFGLWENTDPAPPKPKPKKPSPPPPPPKAEPVWYNCTSSVVTHLSTKELDDLEMGLDGFNNMPRRDVEVAAGIGDLGAGIGEPFEMFEKEDMSDMFRRAMLEKMAMTDENNRPKYNCYVCKKVVQGRVITAQCNKFHPECFVCTYCRKEFKDRKFKSEHQKPYCFHCFEKVLGHYGTAHGRN